MENWSEESKRSYQYEDQPIFMSYYYDTKYRCKKCKTKCVFTAEEKKETFEVKQAYIWQRRTLCKICFEEYNENLARAQSYEKLWAEESHKTSSVAYLAEWLEILKVQSKYGKKYNSSMKVRIEKLLKENVSNNT